MGYTKLQLERNYSLGFFAPLQELVVASSNLNNNSARGQNLVTAVNKRLDTIIQGYNLLGLLRNI